MKKNIIFLHLESLNHTIFSHRQWFPFLNKLYSQSIRLNNFVSSATSSLMAFSDLLHGDDDTLEHNTQLETDITVRRPCPSLFDSLKQHGYTTAGMGYPRNWANVDALWSEKETFNWYETSKEMFADMAGIITQEQPFALYLWNLSSHLCYYDEIKSAGGNSLERWQRGYQSMDLMVGQTIKMLIEAQKLQDTIIIGFGDHGDDFWGHGFNGGYAHGIEPYTSLVHTPAFIFCPGMKSTDLNHMVSMVDLRNTALALLNLPSSQAVDRFFALTPQRQVCYSRNLFAKQKSQDKGSPLKKGYAITSADLHLLKVDDKSRLFLWKVDPANQLDILPLIKHDKSGKPFIDLEKANRQRTGGAHPHIKHFFSSEMALLLNEQYRAMHEQLSTWMDKKKKLAEAN
ncbi:sulfatase-like hydrolase/transferase [unidentified bacterial endosymbiont]|uniref:sulfatase-like hydrolase/transferase n=1 Tax=unidentified bacterial endosymbiont TaxID=2355 RepID=UPI00209C8DA6|nr:sulfatase-like hydrolase/transferase [unidentified bacterial endosymbiont]